MRYFKFTATTPYCGTDNDFYFAFPDTVAAKDLEERADELAHDNGESFEYMVFGWGVDPVEEGEMTEEERDETIEDYYTDCTCEIVEISETEWIENGGEEA